MFYNLGAWKLLILSLELNLYQSTLFQRLDERDFGHQKEVNKRKQMLLEGKVRKCYFFPSMSCGKIGAIS